MPGSSDRPYGRSSISELEAIFRRAKANAEVLRKLDHELGYRGTRRASKLHSMVVEAQARPPSIDLVGPSTAISKGPRTTSSAAVTSLLTPTTRSAPAPAPNAAPKSDPFLARAVMPGAQNIRPLPSSSVPTGRNDPTATLAAWTALEALSPQTYRRPEDLASGDRRCVVRLSAGRVPWEIRETSRPNYQLYYQVPLGSIAMEAATEELTKAFGHDDERSRRLREKAVIGAVLVNRDGIPVEENGIAVSSFAWALPLALKLKLGDLGGWPSIEPDVIEKLDAVLRRVDPEGRPVPLDFPTIDKAHRLLLALCGLPAHLVEPPTFALRVYHYYKARNPPEVFLLNSFFLHDLARGAALVRQNAAPNALRRYLGVEKPSPDV